MASGVKAISYDGNGMCNFEYVSQDVLNGECNLELQNRSNKAVTFEVEFLDTFFREDEVRMESLMNIAGPYRITLETNTKKAIHFKGLLELSGLPNHIEGGTSNGIHVKLLDEETARIL